VVPEYPRFDSKIRLEQHRQAAGGQTATAMVALRRLGLRTAYCGRFGSDEEGKFSLNSLITEGVNVDYSEVVKDSRNQIAFILVESKSGERTVIWDRDERLAYGPEDVPLEFARRGSVLHLDAHDPPACLALAKIARESGTIVSADIDNIYKGLEDLLPFIDILISSKNFPRRLTGIEDPKLALKEIKSRYGIALLGMTLGTQGALIYHDDQYIKEDAFEVPGGCVDTTGAGDAFHGGFLYGLLTGEEIEPSLRLGCAVAALKCRQLGTRPGLPSKIELKRFLGLP
jgi:sulfofructose kinase